VIPRDTLLHHVQRMLMHDLDLSYAQVEVDDDGDVCLFFEDDLLVIARLVTHDGQEWVRLWSVAATGLRRNAKLLREVNEINSHLFAARVLLTDFGALIVSGELLAESLGKGELGTLARIIGDTVNDVGTLVQLVFGGAADENEDTPVAPGEAGS
jgi:hypothetical protein